MSNPTFSNKYIYSQISISRTLISLIPKNLAEIHFLLLFSFHLLLSYTTNILKYFFLGGGMGGGGSEKIVLL